MKFRFTWKYLVWKRVKAQPSLRSNACLASTDNDSFSLGFPKLLNAFLISISVIAENLARKIWSSRRRSVCPTALITSKHMFSPSRSQSSHKTRYAIPRASDWRWSTMWSLGLASFWMVSAVNNSSGSTASQLLNFALKGYYFSRLNFSWLRT